MSVFSSSFKRTANSPQRFDKPWQDMETLQNKQDGSWIRKIFFVYSLKHEHNNTDLLSSDSQKRPPKILEANWSAFGL